MATTTTFEPRIVTFLCWKWGYGACDMAGTMRAQYPASIRPVRVICTARVSSDMILRAFNKGADGVLVAGWHLSECDYQTGNEYARKMVLYLQDVLESMGLERERLQMIFVSAAEGAQFQQYATKMHKDIVKLGPSKLRIHQTEAAIQAAQKAKQKAAKTK